MRALRDFNLPKIVTDDVPIIMGLIGDLFPALDVPRKRDMDFEKLIRQATLDQKLQPEDNFILKVSIVLTCSNLNLFLGPHSLGFGKIGMLLGAFTAGLPKVWERPDARHSSQVR